MMTRFSGARRIFQAVSLLTALCATTPLTAADKPTFSELLARAKMQAATGHRWGPAGDNMTETVLNMMDLVPTATPEQLSELSTLLESEETAPLQRAPGPDAFGERPLTPPTIANIPSSTPPPTGVPAPPLALAPPSSPPTRQPAPVPVPVPSTTASGPRAAVLYARGLEAEHREDFSAARRLYFSAAQQGDTPAARSLGRLYDPDYLRHSALSGVDPDPAVARQWYERAVQLGDTEAGPLLQALSAR